MKHYQINTIILKNNYEALSDKHNNLKRKHKRRIVK